MEYRIKISKDIVIDADINLLKRLYENFISNMIKYASEGKYIYVKSSNECTEFIVEIPYNYIDRLHIID